MVMFNQIFCNFRLIKSKRKANILENNYYKFLTLSTILRRSFRSFYVSQRQKRENTLVSVDSS